MMNLTFGLVAALFLSVDYAPADEPVFGKPLSVVEGEEGLIVEARALLASEGEKVFPAGFYRYVLTHRDHNKSDLNSFFSDYHIVHFFEGSHPVLSKATFELHGKQVFQLQYHAGANQTVLEFGIEKNGLLKFFDTSIVSNMSKFNISKEGMITSYNSLHSVSKGTASVCTHNYEFLDSERLVEISRSSECDT